MPLLEKVTKDDITYWGNPAFVDKVINSYIEGGWKEIGSGAFGTAYSGTVDGTKYLIKVLQNDDTDKQMEFKTMFESECDIANILQEKIPDYVTKIQGARFNSEDTQYILFDYLEGQTLTKVLEAFAGAAISDDNGLKQLHTDLSKLYYSVNEAIKAIHNIGYVHSDIKPDNLFIDTNNRCKLIDFGATGEIGEPITVSSEIYSAQHIELNSWPKKYKDQRDTVNRNTLTPAFNIFSLDRIWQIDMLPILQDKYSVVYKLYDPLPEQKGGRRTRHRNYNKKRRYSTKARR
jgi:hypothetical protein